MAYFQMDDGFDTDLRVIRAGTAAFGLYSRCGVWVANNLTDGFVPAEVAALYGTREWIEKLAATGLWEPAEGGFDMPDYLGIHGNPTAETVRKRRADAALRKQRQRDKTRKPLNKSQGESRVTGPGTHGGSHRSQASPPPKGGEGDGPALRAGAAPPPSNPTRTLTSGRVICATHHQEIPDGGTCRSCAADLIAAGDRLDDLDQRPPVHTAQAPPGIAERAADTAAYASARRLLDARDDRDHWLAAARAELADEGDTPTMRAITIRAAELADDNTA